MKSLLLLTLLCAVTLTIQAQTEMPKPGPEVKKLDVFAGSWTVDGDQKAGAMGPGGKITETETCKWMEGDFFLVCHTEFKSPTSSGMTASYFGYDTTDKLYTYDEFASSGEALHAKATVDGDTWTWTSEWKMGSKTMNGRFTVKVLSPASYSFMFEMSQDQKTWTTVLDGRAMKKK
jgi:Protein of unknown function (DUF1579)